MVSPCLLSFLSFMCFRSLLQAEVIDWGTENDGHFYIDESNFGNTEHETRCDLFSGKWVFDDSFSFYNFSMCPVVFSKFDCLKNGRPDREYLKYRWQPNGCDLPRFDGSDFFSRFRGKKIMFIGDSISYSQWLSLVCLLHSSDPQVKTYYSSGNGYYNFTFIDYELTVSCNFLPYIVDVVIEDTVRVLKLDSMRNAISWKDEDLLVFNTALWWGRKTWDVIQDGNQTYMDMETPIAYRKALTTWANWVDTEVDHNKTQVFFRAISPSHYNGREWGAPAGTTCVAQRLPMNGSMYSGTPPWHVKIMKEVLRKMAKPAFFLDILAMSQLREDAHVSIYNNKLTHGKPDCTHFCIAGLPDIWNQILYAILISSS